MKLVYKLIILAACIGVPLALTAIIFTNITKEALELKIRERHLELAENFASEADSFFLDFQKYISTFLYNYKATELDDEKLKDYLSSLMIQFEDIRILTVMSKDREVRVQLQAPWEISPSAVSRHVSLINPKKVIAESIVDTSDAYADRGGGAPLVTMTFTFPDRERVLAAEISLKAVQELLARREFERNESAFIIDGRGRMIAHSTSRAAPASQAAPATGGLKTLDDLTEMKIVREILGRTSSGVVDYRDNEGRHQVGAYHNTDAGWMVVVQQSSRDAYYTAIRMKNIAMISVSVVVFIALVLGIIIARSIIAPVYKLVTGAEEIGKGNIDYKVGISSRDEVGFLARAFDRMSSSLSEREKAIENVSDAAKRVSSIIDRDQMAGATLDVMGKIARARTIAIMLPESRDGAMKAYVRENGRVEAGAGLPPKLEAAAKRAMTRKMVVDADKAGEPKIGEIPRASIAIPIIFEDIAKGAVIVDGNLNREGFTATDLQLFGIITSSVAISVRNIELLEDTIEKTRMEQELKTAELVQKTFFPEKPPDVPGLDLSGFIESASETGGDWYGFVDEPENRRTAILIADVTGHGVSAALVTATTSSFFKTLEMFRSFADERDGDSRAGGVFDPLSPDFMLRCLNEIILKSTKRRLVMTLFACVYHHDTQKLVYANAGHNPPMIFRGAGLPSGRKGKKPKQVGYLLSRGVRLGDEEKVEFTEKTFQLLPGDTLLWYTDGLIECENEAGEEFGERRLLKLFEEVADGGKEAIKTKLLQETGAFFGNAPHKDDITFIIGKVMRKSPSAAAPRAHYTARDGVGALQDKNILIVNGDKTFARRLAWFLKSQGIGSVEHFTDIAPAAGGIGSGAPDVCVLPIGGGLDELSLAAQIKEKHPGAKMIFTTAAPFDDIIPILLERDLPLRLAAADSESLLPVIQTAVLKLLDAQFWGISHYLDRGAKIRRLTVSDSFNRSKNMRPLAAFAEKIGFNEYSVNRIMSIADEMVTNAIYDAPRDEAGKAKYAEMPRPLRLELEDRETPAVEYGADARHLAIGVADLFGALDRRTLLEYLCECLRGGGERRDEKKGGAGLGLYMLFQMADHFVVNVDPGKKTEMICFIKSQTDVKSHRGAIETLMYFEKL